MIYELVMNKIKTKNKGKTKNINKYLTKVYNGKRSKKLKNIIEDKKETKSKKKKDIIEDDRDSNEDEDKDKDKDKKNKELVNKLTTVKIINKNNTNSIVYSVPWTEKYRPTKLEHVKSQKSINILENALKTGDLPNLLIYGNPGTGKTTSVLALCKQLFGPIKYKERVLELNASDERGINVVRGKIINFSKILIGNTVPDYLCPPFKVIILDEADEMTKEGQSALRKVMEDNLNITRFIFICNYSKHIIEPINSRCVKIRFNPINKYDIRQKLTEISNKEELKIEKNAIREISKYTSGDLRKSILMLQNLKYIKKDNETISKNDINELCKYITQYEFDEIIKNIRNINNKNNIKYVMNMVDSILNNGHVFESVIEKVIYYITNFDTSDLIKAKILFKLSDVDKKINGRASEYIQLLNLLNMIRML
jgi:replication factor C subunit 2/4